MSIIDGRFAPFFASLRSVFIAFVFLNILPNAPLSPAHWSHRFACSLAPSFAPLRVLRAWCLVAPLRCVNSPSWNIRHSSFRKQVNALRFATSRLPVCFTPHTRLLRLAFAPNSHRLFVHKSNPPPLTLMRPCAALRLREQPAIAFFPCRGQTRVVRLCLSRSSAPTSLTSSRLKHMHRLRFPVVKLPPFHLAQGAGGARRLSPFNHNPVIRACPAGGFLILQLACQQVAICVLAQ